MEKNITVFPYISTIKDLVPIVNEYNYKVTLDNDEEAMIGIETFKEDELLVIPKGTILSAEFLDAIGFLDGMVDSDFKVVPYSVENITFNNIALPLAYVAYALNLDYNSIKNYPKNKELKGFYTKSQEMFLIAPDYSVDDINYEFDPRKYSTEDDNFIPDFYSNEEYFDNNEEFSTEKFNPDFVGDGSVPYKNPKIIGEWKGGSKTFELQNAWFIVLSHFNITNIANEIKDKSNEEAQKIVKSKIPAEETYKRIMNFIRRLLNEFVVMNKIHPDKILKMDAALITVKSNTKISSLSYNSDFLNNTEIKFEKYNPLKSSESLDPLSQSTEAYKEFPQVFLNPEQIEKLLEIRDYKEFDQKNINKRDWLISIFSNRREAKPDGKGFEVLPPLIPIEGYFKLPANTLPNQPEEILTTAGLYIFNMFCIASAFKHKIPYINHEINADALEGLNNELAGLLLQNKIGIKDEIEVFQNNTTYISYLTEIFMPGISVELLEELPEVKTLKKDLVEKYKKEIEAGDAAFYSDNVEKPLLNEAKKILSKDESWDIYSIGKKPTFGNNYKSNVVSVGPIKNPITDRYDIITNSYDNGIELDKYSVYCNQLISGTYDRSVKTQYGGAKTKQIFGAMGNIVADKAGSDCGTNKYLKMILNKKEAKDYLYSYIIDKKTGELIELTPEVIDKYYDQEIMLRTPLYCWGKKICNKCLGNLYYRLGIECVGIATSRISASIMYKSMKSFHDQSIKTAHIDLKKFVEVI